jgi:hypothetical protein
MALLLLLLLLLLLTNALNRPVQLHAAVRTPRARR